MKENLHFIAIGLILKDNTEIKCIISISKGNSNPKKSTLRIFQPYCISPGAIISLNNCFFVVGWNFGLSKDFAIFINECNFDYSIFFCNFNSSLPNHILPIIKVVSLWCGQRRYFEDGNSFCLVAQHQLRRLHTI